MTTQELFRLFCQQNTNGRGRKERRYIETYGDIPFEEAFPIYLEEINIIKGRFDKIFFKGYLKRDPIEWSEKYEKIIDEANKKIYALLEDYPRGMGFCLAYWSVKEKVLREDYGVKWKSPVIMNPGVIFD